MNCQWLDYGAFVSRVGWLTLKHGLVFALLISAVLSELKSLIRSLSTRVVSRNTEVVLNNGTKVQIIYEWFS